MIFLKTKIMIFQEGIFMIFYDTGIAMQTIVYKTGVMNTSRMSFFSPLSITEDRLASGKHTKSY